MHPMSGRGFFAIGFLVWFPWLPLDSLIPLYGQSTEHGALLGQFEVTYYYVAQERREGDWPLFGPSCGTVLARTSPEFHSALSREGTGRLQDGRLLNFVQRCPCARPGHRGSRICYEVLDVDLFPWGRGGLVSGRLAALKPFRSVAVDPAVIPLGTVLFIPQWAARHTPDGQRLDGCFRAEDTGRMIKNHRLDLFAGTPRWAQIFRKSAELSHVTVFLGGERCRGVFSG